MKFLPTRKRLCVYALLIALLVFGGRLAAIHAWHLVRWKAHIWVPSYLSTGRGSDPVLDGADKHLIFTMFDHYEPGRGQAGAGVETNRQWLHEFRRISARNVDNYGNMFRYSWFYPLIFEKFFNQKFLRITVFFLQNLRLTDIFSHA